MKQLLEHCFFEIENAEPDLANYSIFTISLLFEGDLIYRDDAVLHKVLEFFKKTLQDEHHITTITFALGKCRNVMGLDILLGQSNRFYKSLEDQEVRQFLFSIESYVLTLYPSELTNNDKKIREVLDCLNVKSDNECIQIKNRIVNELDIITQK